MPEREESNEVAGNAVSIFDWKGDARYRWKDDWAIEYACAPGSSVSSNSKKTSRRD